MSLVSYGYDGFISPAPVWGLLQRALNHQYFVYGCKVTPDTAESHRVQIATGYFGGIGIYNNLTSVAYVDTPVPGSGTKWYLIKAVQNMVTHTTTLVAQDCGTAQYHARDSSVPLPTLSTDYDGEWDVPLALVPMAAGGSIPGTPIDLRVLGIYSGCYTARDENVVQFLNEGGVSVAIDPGDGSNPIIWHRVLAPTTGYRWIRAGIRNPGMTWSAGTVVDNGSNGWARTGVLQEAYIDNGLVDLYVELKCNAGSSLTFSGDSGHLADVVIATLDPKCRPIRPRTVQAEVISSANSNHGCFVSLEPGGSVILKSGPAGVTIRRLSDSWDLRFSDTFNRREFTV